MHMNALSLMSVIVRTSRKNVIFINISNIHYNRGVAYELRKNTLGYNRK